MKFYLSESLLCVLQTSGISEREISQCFQNREGAFLCASYSEMDVVIESAWFVSYTNKLRKMKVVFSYDGQQVSIISACEADDVTCRIYSSKC